MLNIKDKVLIDIKISRKLERSHEYRYIVNKTLQINVGEKVIEVVYLNTLIHVFRQDDDVKDIKNALVKRETLINEDMLNDYLRS